jgi:hypothetical protein
VLYQLFKRSKLQTQDKKSLRLTRTIKYINSSRFLQTAPGTLTGSGLVVRRPRTCFLLRFNKVTANQLLIKLVPRHSYTLDNLYPDGKNRAVPRSFRLQGDPTPNRHPTQQPSIAPQRLRTLLPGR